MAKNSLEGIPLDNLAWQFGHGSQRCMKVFCVYDAVVVPRVLCWIHKNGRHSHMVGLADVHNGGCDGTKLVWLSCSGSRKLKQHGKKLGKTRS